MTWIYIGSTVVWLLSMLLPAVAIMVKGCGILIINAPVIIETTLLWATVIMNVGDHYWPPLAFALLVMLFALQLLLNLVILARCGGGEPA